jgi:hypothetical protein
VAKSNSGGQSSSSPLRSGGSRDGQAGRLDRHEAVAKVTQNKAKSHDGLPGSSQLRSDGSRDSQQGRLDCINGSQRCSRESRKMTLGNQGTYLKTGIVTA